MTEIIKSKKVRVIRKIKKVETNSQVKCDVIDCEEDCNHHDLHDKMKIACDMICGVNKEAKCV